ncbi:embryonic polarity dorsal [Culex quinquefasciatus]|uniref:Embryonic polarity dorsal n=1 Tax=Culex quinquefasciatus TaxID=7176 RepID=B0W322_CULQU|nr:embryonic polarity dorsal [Culex quinquefasciatus]|eukprot:XP_001843106.1 embryonic polarity dorsal [Culex quinquefasciatus]
MFWFIQGHHGVKIIESTAITSKRLPGVKICESTSVTSRISVVFDPRSYLHSFMESGRLFYNSFGDVLGYLRTPSVKICVSTATKIKHVYKSCKFLFTKLLKNGSNCSPHLVITVQPQSRGLRFRYQCENRGSTAGSILGVGSTAQRRIYPTVEIRNHQGPAKIVITCVTSDDPPRLHPHRLVGHKDCSEGLCEMLVEPTPTPVMAHSIKNLGVQCIRRKDVDAELRKKEMRYANPFNGLQEQLPTGNSSTINLNEIRLCFQLHIESYPGQFIPVSYPVLSTIIYDKKSNPDLIICSMSDCTGPASGGKQIILLTEKVNKDDIQVRFFKEFGPDLKPWIAYGALSSGRSSHANHPSIKEGSSVPEMVCFTRALMKRLALIIVITFFGVEYNQVDAPARAEESGYDPR